MTVDEFMDKHKNLVYGAIRQLRHAIDYNKTMEVDDAKQYALLGLWNVYKNFDPKYGIKVSTMALPTMKGKILHGFREYDSGAGVKFSREGKELARKHFYDKETSELTQEFIQQIQKEEGVSDYIMESALNYYLHCVRGVLSVDKTTNIGEEDSGIPVLDAIARHVDDYDSELPIVKFRSTLEGRELALYDYLLAGYTQREIGEKIGVSQMHAGRLRKELHAKYKKFEAEERAYDY